MDHKDLILVSEYQHDRDVLLAGTDLISRSSSRSINLTEVQVTVWERHLLTGSMKHF